MAIQISKYTRPGVYIEEIDGSVQQLPAQTDLAVLVPGFSKKGPINKPVKISTISDLTKIYGQIDRNLEKKGSFFHRTISTVVGSAPVYALNLLQTDDDLDLLEWQSISTSPINKNRAKRNDSYSKFFNKNEFWERDPEAFLYVANQTATDNTKAFHITNMSDKKNTVFIFKSGISGFDVSAESWYGGKEKVPTYIHPTELISDYLISIVVIGGDWSNYKALSVDSRWSKYFNTKGLRKAKIQNFLNDSSVTLLKFYDVSLIPYFRDQNNKDMFVETVINQDTDLTGLFVAYDLDKIETDEPNGLIDLVGNSLVGQNVEDIEYLSYKETISESIVFTEAALNTPGNVFGFAGTSGNAIYALETETKISPAFQDVDFTITNGSGNSQVSLGANGYMILNGVSVTLDATENPGNFVVTSQNTALGKIRKDTLYLDGNGVLGIETGFEVSKYTAWEDVPLKPLASGTIPVGTIQLGDQGTSGSGVGVNNVKALAPLTSGRKVGSTSIYDIEFELLGTNEIIISFNNTKDSDPDTNYKKSRANIIFNSIVSKLIQGKSVIVDSTGKNNKINSVTYQSSGTANKSINIVMAANIDIDRNSLVSIFYLDNEFQVGTLGMKTDVASGYGRVAPDSKFYQYYKDGLINTGDYFYQDLFDSAFGAEFVNVSGTDTIRLYTNSSIISHPETGGIINNRIIYIQGSVNNDHTFKVLSVSGPTAGSYNVGSSSYTNMFEVIVNESITPEGKVDGVTVHNADLDDLVYLKMYFVNSSLNVDFTSDPTLAGGGLTLTDPIYKTINGNRSIKVFSKKSNFKQTVEIEAVLDINKILVNASRYNVLKVGDYLEAFVDTSITGGGTARKLTRILEKKAYAQDNTLSQITTDAQIAITTFGADQQTFRYTVMEDYVDTYQAIVLSGFKIRQDSMPDGTEARQSSILDLLSVNTPIAKGLVNRNKIEWRYLIDSFGLGLSSLSKQQLVDLCGNKLNCFGILNMPSAKDFKKSTSPSFLDANGVLSMEYIRLGANPESNPTFTYSFGEGKGQSTVGYFFPHVIINDNGRPLVFPPAPFVANTFLRKHTSRLATVKPWVIAAGLNNGLVAGIANVEIDLDPDDISSLNKLGANPLVYKMNKGFCIETDNTAQADVRSALSYIHVREALVELENEMYEMLLTYQWRFNTPEIRSEIKRKADDICARYVKEQAITAYMNICDETNNTQEIIDSQIGVLDTFVEPIKGMGVIVNNITVLKTGDIASGGFSIA